MDNYKLTIAYDGTRYHGWQRQPGVPTIQGELEDAMAGILDRRVDLHGSGRTDRGVHADGQVAHCLLRRRVQPGTLERGLNALLDPDIRVLAVGEAPPEFHSRFSAVSRTYRYHICRHRVVHPFEHRFVYACWRPLDPDAIDDATRSLTGAHDFSAFSSGTDLREKGTRFVYEAVWERDAYRWVFTIRASGFLRTMVRRIVGTLLEVGGGRRGPEDFAELLRIRDRTRAGPAAPASGLRLSAVDYTGRSGEAIYRP